jgi:hypothetical protein
MKRPTKKRGGGSWAAKIAHQKKVKNLVVLERSRR